MRIGDRNVVCLFAPGRDRPTPSSIGYAGLHTGAVRMKNLSTEGALTETEMDRLTEFLRSSKGHAMNLEELDGFFAALIAGPEVVPPSEYLPELFGGKMSETAAFETLDQARDILGLIMRHWNSIARTLDGGDVHLPILFEDANGQCQGNDWARGFMRGMHMRREAWAEVLNDDEECGWILPVLMLYHEHDEDPELRPEPIGPEKRDEIIVQMAAGIVKAHRYFRSDRQPQPSPSSARSPDPRPKAGRNDRCPCGSGKKYKRCCGSTLVN